MFICGMLNPYTLLCLATMVILSILIATLMMSNISAMGLAPDLPKLPLHIFGLFHVRFLTSPTYSLNFCLCFVVVSTRLSTFCHEVAVALFTIHLNAFVVTSFNECHLSNVLTTNICLTQINFGFLHTSNSSISSFKIKCPS